jgi:hypothetical protein
MTQAIASPKSLITTFLIISAVCSLFGTATVAINYYRTSKAAKIIADAFNPNFSVPFNERARLNNLVGRLTARWYLTLGLVAYGLGALFGLLAGLAGLYRL